MWDTPREVYQLIHGIELGSPVIGSPIQNLNVGRLAETGDHVSSFHYLYQGRYQLFLFPTWGATPGHSLSEIFADHGWERFPEWIVGNTPSSTLSKCLSVKSSSVLRVVENPPTVMANTNFSPRSTGRYPS